MVQPTSGYATYEVAPDSEGNHAFSSTVTYSCSVGLGIVGPLSSTCDENGNHDYGVFTPDPPVCERKSFVYVPLWLFLLSYYNNIV